MSDVRVKFCWECGKQLYQRKICTKMEIHGHIRTLHKSCAEKVSKGDQKDDYTGSEALDNEYDQF